VAEEDAENEEYHNRRQPEVYYRELSGDGQKKEEDYFEIDMLFGLDSPEKAGPQNHQQESKEKTEDQERGEISDELHDVNRNKNYLCVLNPMAYLELAVLVVSVAVLSRSAAMVVNNIERLSRFFNVSQVAIGFMLLAVATSLPELSVSVVSSSIGEGSIAAGNVFGSNIANILLVLGIGAFLYGMKISAANLRDIGLVLLLTTLISVYIVFNSSVQQRALGFMEGAVLLAIFLAYVWYTLNKRNAEDANDNELITKSQALQAFIRFMVGVIVVIVSSGFVVNSAVELSRLLGVTEGFIGATIIAVGTSLPEISIDLHAIRRKQYGIALGDAIGSNMVNLTLVLGSASVINPITLQIPVFIAALLFAVIANSLLLYAAAVQKKLQKFGGALFLIIYLIYLVTIFALQAGELS
jgi:cation:H+ antiporter